VVDDSKRRFRKDAGKRLTSKLTYPKNTEVSRSGRTTSSVAKAQTDDCAKIEKIPALGSRKTNKPVTTVPAFLVRA
jgi:hypothetical protein